MKKISLILVLLISFPSFVTNAKSKYRGSSEDLDAAFSRLKDVGVDLQPTGTICEYLAKEVLEKKYPVEQFKVVVGIQYGERRNAVGELDMSVVDLEYDEVVYIAEVKCWKNPSAGLKKAKKQITRFLTNLRGNRVNWMKILSPGYEDWSIDSSYFDSNFDVGYIAQKGSKRSGYTDELELSLSDAMKLRTKIMECQSEGSCARAK
jgi:hypothetical protein